MANRLLLSLFLVCWCATWAVAGTTVRGPLRPGGGIPPQTGSGHFWFIDEVCVTESSTVVQHVAGKIRITCVDDGRLVAESTTDYWEYWAFTKACCSMDQHATEVGQTIEQLQRAAAALRVELECRCYRMDVEMTFDLYDGTAAPTTASITRLDGGCGTFGFPAAPSGSAPTSRWRVKDGASWREATDAFRGAPFHGVTFDAGTKRSVTHRATYFMGACPQGSRPAHPVPESYR